MLSLSKSQPDKKLKTSFTNKNKQPMKTMLHLSIALMLIAGSAGVIDFVKMFRTGEIDKIYSHEGPVKKTTVAHKASIVSAAALFENVTARVEEIVIDPDDYGRSALMQEEVFIEEELTEAVGVVEPVKEPIEEMKVELPEPKQAEIILTASTTTDIKDKPIVKDGRKKFKLSMFSRAYIPDEEEKLVLDVKPQTEDSTATSTSEF